MRVLYGVVGEGMGHATRSRVVLEHLLDAGHQVLVVVSGRAHGFLRDALAHRVGLAIQEIRGLHLVHDQVGIDRSASVWSNLQAAPESLLKNVEAYAEVSASFRAQVVISDFESWAFLYGLAHDVPVISIDNMQVINRCRHTPDITGAGCFDYLVAKYSVKSKLPGAWHYLVTSFFFPPVRKKRTTLVNPILRPEILAAEREPGEHVLVYQSAGAVEALLPALRQMPWSFRVYGLDRDEVHGNLALRPFSQQGFVDDLRTARAAIAGGGFSLMGEAVHLHVPLLAVPLEGQYEQELNARYLARLGYGAWVRELTPPDVERFLARVDEHVAALKAYQPRGNEMLFDCLDELLAGIEAGQSAPLALDAPSMGDWAATRIEDKLGHQS